VTLARQLIADFPESEWAAETLNNLASHYIINDDDAAADRVFRELLQRFPKHRHAERAAWKAGWWSYRNGDFAVTADLFENAAGTFPRADNRPAWLYWSGRARDRLGDPSAANARYRLAVTDYQNTYYGRLAVKLLEQRQQPPVGPSATIAPPEVPPAGVPNDDLIRALAAAELYDDALREVQYAQRVWGDSPQLQATFAWVRHRQGLGLKATERFNALRGAINTMRRAYPQFMTAGGENLPPDVLRIIFPIDYWPLITKYAKAHDLDPYLLAALMAQESTFTPEIRSAANAYGLMQITPPTGRTLARQLGIRRFTTSMLTQPETNVRMGTKYFKDMVDRFGGVHYALAGYNAGPHRVVDWLKESPGLPQDEFIDNIPFAETQNYVKRILGTAEDYRRLYGTGVLDPSARLVAAR
jgi:soluble lytic murein transglycosylase